MEIKKGRLAAFTLQVLFLQHPVVHSIGIYRCMYFKLVTKFGAVLILSFSKQQMGTFSENVIL